MASDICVEPSSLSFVPGDANRQISEYKFKLSKAEQDITTMEQNVSVFWDASPHFGAGGDLQPSSLAHSERQPLLQRGICHSLHSSRGVLVIASAPMLLPVLAPGVKPVPHCSNSIPFAVFCS